MARSIADTATVLATHKARVAVIEAIEQQTKAITATALEDGCKAPPAKESNSGVHELTEGDGVEKVLYAPILKANDEQRTVLGVVLQPETVDAQGDIYSEAVVEKAAENFLAKFNKATKLGYMHKNFNKRFELLQSFIAPMDMAIGNKVVKKGSWIMKVRVLDSGVWKLVKEGKIKGFSIGGKAKVAKLTAA